jgi:hypothetical protein
MPDMPAYGLLTKPVRALSLRTQLVNLLSPEAEKKKTESELPAKKEIKQSHKPEGGTFHA